MNIKNVSTSATDLQQLYIVFGIEVCLAINHSLYKDEPALNIIFPLFMGIARECLITGTIHYFSILSIGYNKFLCKYLPLK
jgi:hypothetical protein